MSVVYGGGGRAKVLGEERVEGAAKGGVEVDQLLPEPVLEVALRPAVRLQACIELTRRGRA